MSIMSADEPEETVAVYAAPSEIMAEIMRGVLSAEGIIAVVGEQATNGYAGAIAVGDGFWGELRVAPEDAASARSLIEAYAAGEGTVSDAELTAEAEASSDPGV